MNTNGHYTPDLLSDSARESEPAACSGNENGVWGIRFGFFLFFCEIERHKEKPVKELCQIELPGGVLFLSDSRMFHDDAVEGGIGRGGVNQKFQVWFLHKTSI